MPALFHYEVVQDPSAVTVKAGITDISPTEVKAEVTWIEPFSCTLHSRDQGIIQTVGTVVAAFGLLFLEKPYTYLRDQVVGAEQKFSFEKPIGFSFTANDDTVTVNAASLAVETHHGMLMAHGSVEIG
ncbi:hypothetical protein [Streptomyces cacaoi]|uniref:Uncharacterized protein n=1 Tax=Streptomyces cacaoi TaxID=1898 RepID=A0A4Y3QWU6_STRCI|nr:hypothetical protein [Streptomyces cacaoi]NNG85040.1 hypothetical protein [Streptomyces cacaoi]GEB49692.1 hypothetical protein SCA03_22430 [Streptomyces cacaoi]